MNQPAYPDSPLPLRASDLLATGLGTAAAMWVAGYILHIPLIQPYVPNWLVFVALVIVMLSGGYVFGRDSFRGWATAWLPPLITALVNMLIFSSVLQNESRDTLMVSLPGFFIATEAVMLIGFAIGKARRPASAPQLPGANWRLRLALVPVAATALVVAAGGLVTGNDAGFSVPDWPTTYGANMFLYPVAHMTGGIYYEHAHRLAGTLVGFVAIVLMLWTWIADGRNGPQYLALRQQARSRGFLARIPLRLKAWAVDHRWSVSLFTTLAFLMVVAQGVAGGLWVESASLPYILFHGSFGQLILAAFAAIAATHTVNWRKLQPLQTPSASTDHWLTVTLLLAFILQTVLGVYVRQRPEGPLIEHITFAGIVAALVLAVALRGLILYRKQLPPIKRLSHGLLHGTALQIILGIVALIVRQHNQGIGAADKLDAPLARPSDALITTLHQSVGAFLLALAALAVAWNWRLLRKTK